jgi:hypothetical protein
MRGDGSEKNVPSLTARLGKTCPGGAVKALGGHFLQRVRAALGLVARHALELNNPHRGSASHRRLLGDD